MTDTRYPAATSAASRAATHRLIDRILDTRPDLEDKITDVLGGVSRKLAEPGVAATMGLITSAKRLLEAIDRPPPPRAGGGGFRATAS